MDTIIIPPTAPMPVHLLYEVYESLRGMIGSGCWSVLHADDISFAYQNDTDEVKICCQFTDSNGHSHLFALHYQPATALECEYRWIPPRNYPRNYTEWVMMQLWDYGYESEMPDSDARRLSITADFDDCEDVMMSLFNIVCDEVMPEDWFESTVSLWPFASTYEALKTILIKVQREAEFDRWPRVRPEHFFLSRGSDHALLCLDFTDDKNFRMEFRLGMEPDDGMEMFTGQFRMHIYYRFTCLSEYQDVNEYFMSQHDIFASMMQELIAVTFSWNAILSCSTDGTYLTIDLPKPLAFQRYCLFLDILMPLKEFFVVKDMYMSSDVLLIKEMLEHMINDRLSILKDDEQRHIFAIGHFNTDLNC